MKNLPLVAIVAPPGDRTDADVVTRMISAGNPHGAIPLTGAMCLVSAASVPGTVVHACMRSNKEVGDVRIAHASGVLPVAATVRVENGQPRLEEAVVYRTARRLMEGRVLVPAS
jgi:hypothetical protein